MELEAETKVHFESVLTRQGMRVTKQRELVYSVIHKNFDHPTAEGLYAIARKEMPSISLATIYNCLESLVICGLVREVQVGRNPTRYEPISDEHAHFICDECGEVFDIRLSDAVLNGLKEILPNGFVVDNINLSFTGRASCEDAEDCEDKAEQSGLTTQILGN